jgi:S1-C subfamily serine protease
MGIGSGNPFNLTSTVIPEVMQRLVCWVFTAVEFESFISNDRLYSSNSGGALVITKGGFGGNQWRFSLSNRCLCGLRNCQSVSIMTIVVSDLKQYGTVQRALLGIKGGSLSDEQLSDAATKKAKELGVVDGVLVAEVIEGGSAAGAGIKVDDVIIGIDGHKVRNMAELKANWQNIVRRQG